MSVWSYEGKRVAIVGCFSGMGEACAHELRRLGAEVHGADVRKSQVKMASFRPIDLKDRASIDAAVDDIAGNIDALFNCAGLPQTFSAIDVMKVNFIGMRHWTERWLPRMKRGGAIVTISSNAGYQYAARLPTLLEFLAQADWDSASAWVKTHPEVVADGYAFSKEAINVWTMQQGARLAKGGVRINCTCPGPTITPMMDDFVKVAPKQVFDAFSQPTGRHATPAEQAYPLIFLNSDAAAFISGQTLMVDGGFVGGVASGEIDVQKLVAQAFANS
ncbi:MAG: coniferyl-alcohol dehydrogenase [Caulobacteraceae bacterium]